MRKVNFILLGFLGFVFLLVLGIQGLIQSERFAKTLTGHINETAFKKMGTEIQFSKMKIQLFPPGAAFIDVKMHANKIVEGENIEGKFEKLVFEFGLMDILANRLVIKNIHAEKGFLQTQGLWSQKLIENLNNPQKDQSSSEKDRLLKVFELYQKQIYSQMPIQIEELSLNEVALKFSQTEAFLDHLNFNLSKERLDIEGGLRHINLKELSYFRNYENITSIDIGLSFYKDLLRFRHFDLKWKKESLFVKGDITEKKGDLEFKNKVILSLDAEEAWALLPPSIKEKQKVSGNIQLNINVSGPLNRFSADFLVEAKDLRTPWADLDLLNVTGRIDDQKLSLKKIHAEHNQGKVDLLSEISLWDIKGGHFIQKEASFYLNQLHTNSALRVLSPTLDILKTKTTGKLLLSWSEKTGDIFFTLLPGFIAEDFHLKDITGKTDILTNKKLVFNKSIFQLTKKFNLIMDLDFTFPSSHIQTKGEITDGRLKFLANQNLIDMKHFGPISGTPFEGQGLIDMTIEGPFEDVAFHFNVNASNFSVIGFNLGNVKGELDLFLKDTRLVLKNIKGVNGGAEFEGSGDISFEKAEPLNLSINLKKAHYLDLRKMLAPLFQELTFIPKENVDFLSWGPWKIQGAFDVKKLKVQGSFFSKDIQLYGEDFESADFSFLFDNNSVSCSNIKIQKGLASIFGKLSYDLGSDFLEFDANSKKVKLTDFRHYRSLGLGYSAEIQGEFYGSGTLDDLSTKAYLNLTKGYVSNIAVPDSVISLYGNGTDLFLKGNFLGDIFDFDSYFNFSKKSSPKESYFNAKIQAQDAKIFWGLFSSANALDHSLIGNLEAQIKSTFTFNGWKDFDVFLELNDFWLSRKEFGLKINPRFNKVIVKNGNIAVWNLQFLGNDNSIVSLGEGDFSTRLRIQNTMNIGAGIAEVFSDKIQKMNGRLKGRSVLSGDHENFSHFFEFNGENLFLRLSDLPIPLEGIQLGVVGNNDQVLIRDCHGHLGNGEFSLDGNITLRVPYPIFDLTGQIKNSYIPFLKKSYAVASGKVRMSGTQPPYKIEGTASLLQAEFLDEFSAVMGKSSLGGSNRFVPKTGNAPMLDFVSFKIDWGTIRPIFIKNSMAELKIEGHGVLSGGNSQPFIQGEFNLLPNESKFYFKGHEFVIGEGKLLFNDPLVRNEGEVRLQGAADINQYKVKLGVSGKTSNPNISLMADPYLSQEDILSLLTIGVTSDLSRGMRDVERRSMTSVGIGTLLMDQMHLNQGLGNELGLRVSVMPEFSEDESTLMVGRTDATGGTSSRVKSATKIRLQKKVTNKVDVSVSSTLGGSMDQKQEMNINYNLGRIMTLQGVYEVKSTDSGDAASTETSAGADLKFRWSFK